MPARPAPLVGLMLLFAAAAIAPALVLYLVRMGRGAAPGEASALLYPSLASADPWLPPLRQMLCSCPLGKRRATAP